MRMSGSTCEKRIKQWRQATYGGRRPSVRCNSLYKKETSLNCCLTPEQALEVARHLQQHAQFLVDNGVEDGGIHLYCPGEDNERLIFAFTDARKGPRRKRKAPVTPGE
jgi:hypothetical protein